jgi:hypothetical protein
LKNPSVISPSVKVVRSARRRDAMAAFSADTVGGETTTSNAMPARTTASIRNTYDDRRGSLIGSTLPQLPRARKA